MFLYQVRSRILKKVNSCKFNLTTAITPDILDKYNLTHINWHICYDGTFFIIITFNEYNINKSKFNVIYEKKVQSTIDPLKNYMNIPVSISKILDLDNHDPILIKEYTIGEEFLICVHFSNPIKYEKNFENIYQIPIINNVQSKLRFYNTPELSVPRIIRDIMSLKEGDLLSITIYKNLNTNKKYVELHKLDDLINYESENEDKIVFRTIKKMYPISTLYCINNPNKLIDEFDLYNFTFVNWNIFMNKDFLSIRLEFS